MLTVEVTLLHRTIRAGSADDAALTGHESPGEWPPSPARLFSALVAADGTRERCQVTGGSELKFLERQRPPAIHADASADVTRSHVRGRFVVVNEKATGAVQNYPARTSGVARPGTRLSPKCPTVAYVWKETVVDPATLYALELRAARIGYLGCSDSPVRVRVSTDAPGETMPTTVWEPDPAGVTSLPIPFDGLVDVLDDAYDQFCKGGTRVRRSWFRTEHARYREPVDAGGAFEELGTTLWLRLDRAVSGRRVLAVTETLREAILDLYQRKVVGVGAELPPVLLGHGYEGRGYQHAHWLALPDLGHPHARGRIHGAAIWLPSDTPDDIVAGVRTAVWHLRELVRPGVFKVGVRPHGGEARPYAAAPRRWQGPSKRWISAFPVVHERFVRPRPSLADLTEWCEHAGLPAPVAFRESRVPLLVGAADLAPQEVFRKNRERRPYSHVELAFDRPIRGPVVVGGARQFGLGLCAPIAEQPDGGVGDA